MIPDDRFILDSESDVYEHIVLNEGTRRETIVPQHKTRLLQLCGRDARSLNDVQLIHGWDAWNRFFDVLEGLESRKTIHVHCWNLSYEFSHMWRECLRDRYMYEDATRPSRGCWTAVSDTRAVYQVRWVSPNNVLVEFSDDMRRFGGLSMENAARSVRAQHPDWFPMDEVKLESDYSEGWLDPNDPRFEKSIRYAVQDGFSQAMILRYLDEMGYLSRLTAPSIGLDVSLGMVYKAKGPSDFLTAKWNLQRFVDKHPPLDREMQDIAEQSLLGGFVWGETGTWFGHFIHLDYSSSYPYEYAYGNMFSGVVHRTTPEARLYHRLMESPVFFRWLLVSFDFRLRDGMPGVISGRECIGDMTGRWNKKFREGRVERRLYTEDYLNELKEWCDITGLEIHEVWFAKRAKGEFKPFIEKCYMEKQKMKHEGRKDWAEYHMNKLFMNGGVHGKTITKTHRKKKTYEDGEEHTIDELNEPKLCFLIGFTAMMNARLRLLKHCRMLLEAGHRILMCDTDSIVTDCTEEEVREIIGDWFVRNDGTMEGDLGRFEVEGTCNEFRCWGLKRYAEVTYGTVDGVFGRRLTRTAFAGMHEKGQRTLLNLPTDGTVFEWEQSGKRTLKYGANIVTVKKHARAECVWDEGEMHAPAYDPNRVIDLRPFIDLARTLKASKGQRD